jgi:DNA modification methylase
VTDNTIQKTGNVADQIEGETATSLSKKLDIQTGRTCECPPTHINCLTPKEWIKCQMGVWQFNYESRDIRDKAKHPATFPIALARRCIELFSHEGELILDPFMGSGTTLVAAKDVNRNAIGFDIHPDYVRLTQERLKQDNLFFSSKQIPVLDDARHIAQYLDEESITCVVTSPPYANLLNRKRLNKSRRGDERKNEQYLKVEQYSQRTEDLGTLDLDAYAEAMAEIFQGILPLLKKKGHCVINVPDMWWENKRITIHVAVIEALRSVGYELRNTIIWDRMNVVNNVGIFGWPSNYITMGTTFEYLLDFWRPPVASHQNQTGEITTGEVKDASTHKGTAKSNGNSLSKTQSSNGKFPQELEDLINQYLPEHE